jgi:hypothetical protein
MKLMKVSIKKKWRYKYDSIEEMISHLTSMKTAKFNVEYYDEANLVIIFSQTIEEASQEEQLATDEIIYISKE